MARNSITVPIPESEYAETCNQVLEPFYGHVSSSSVAVVDTALHFFAHVELPSYIYSDQDQLDHILRLLKTHLRIVHALQDDEVTINPAPRKRAGDLDDYISRNY